MSDTVRIRVSIRTGVVGSECSDVVEFDRDDWEEMSDEQRDEEMYQAAMNMAEWNWEEV